MKGSASPRSLMRAGVSPSWSDEALAAIHAAALEVLRRVGVKAPSPALRTLMLGAGCTAGDSR